MTTNNKAALTLILGTLGGLATMALHPTGHDVTDGQAALNIFVHSLALFSQALLLMGTFAATLQFKRERSTAIAAYIVFAWASVAIMMATTMSGFIATALLGGIASQTGTQHDITNNALRYTGLLNHSFALIFTAFSSLAIVIWSSAMLRENILSRPLALYGIVFGSLTLLMTLTGNLSMSIHGFGGVVLAQGIWYIWLAAQMRDRAVGETV